MSAQFMPLSALRSAAEKRLAAHGGSHGLAEMDQLKLIHELEVHQLELEMQNELLAESCVQAEALRAKYQQLYELAPVGYLTLSPDGRILEMNRKGSSMLGQKPGQDPAATAMQIRSFFDVTSLADLDGFLAQALAGPQEVSSSYLLLRRKGLLPLTVKMQGQVFSDVHSSQTTLRLAMMDVSTHKAAMDDVIKAIHTGSGFSPL